MLEIASALVALVASGLLVLLAGDIEIRRETGGIDPRWWPRTLGYAGVALSGLLALRCVLGPPYSRDDLQAATGTGWARSATAIALAVALVLLWPLVGFIAAALMFLGAVTYLFGGRGWRTLVLFPVLTTAFIYLLFHSLLKVPL